MVPSEALATWGAWLRDVPEGRSLICSRGLNEVPPGGEVLNHVSPNGPVEPTSFIQVRWT